MQTRLLNPQIFLDYLDLYPLYRVKDRSSAFGWFKATVGTGVSKVTREDPVYKKLDKIFAEVKAEIRNARDFKAWLKVITTLRTKAEAAQKLKTLNEPALSWLTLHAVAGFIILELYNTNDELIKYVTELKEKLNKLESDRIEDINKGQGKGVAGINLKNNEIIVALAMLGDLCAADVAIQRHLLDEVTLKLPEPADLIEYGCSDSGNYAAPLCLQPELCGWLYEHKFQSIKQISFNEFRLVAIDNSAELENRKRVEGKAQAQKQSILEEIHRRKRETTKIAMQKSEVELLKNSGDNPLSPMDKDISTPPIKPQTDEDIVSTSTLPPAEQTPALVTELPHAGQEADIPPLVEDEELAPKIPSIIQVTSTLYAQKPVKSETIEDVLPISLQK